MKSLILICFIFASSLLAGVSCMDSFQEAEYRIMDDLAIAAGTDKSSLFHNYTKVYSQHFKRGKNKPIRFLEIGIYKGNSVKFWESYFSLAELHFIDITNQFIEYYSERSKYYFIDQSNTNLLQNFSSHQGPFDIILDDGGHTMNQQISSFLALFPSVKPGGLYVIEDLHTSYWSEFGGSGDINRAGEGTAIGFFKDLVDEVNFPGAATTCADGNKISPEFRSRMTYFREHIESIQFYSSICIIKKK